MTPLRLWLGFVAYWLIAAVSLVAVDPRADVDPWPPIGAAVVGGAAGVVLFVGLAGCRPRLPSPGLLAVVIVAAAVAEEAVWRRLVLGTLADRAGAVAALAASTIAFALAHRDGRRIHLVTGSLFGALYLTSANLVCAASAHAVYNLALTAAARVPRAPEVGLPR